MRSFKSVIIVFAILSACSQQDPNTIANIYSKYEPVEQGDPDMSYILNGKQLMLTGKRNGNFIPSSEPLDHGVLMPSVKLLDGFVLSITPDQGKTTFCLNQADQFSLFPFGSLQSFRFPGLEINQYRFIPDSLSGLIIDYELRNSGNESIALELDFTAVVNLSPKDSIHDNGHDAAEWVPSRKTVIAKDELNSWFAVIGTDSEVLLSSQGQGPCKIPLNPYGLGAVLHSKISLSPGSVQSLRYFISGSSSNLESAVKTYEILIADPIGQLRKKIKK